jgi:hypothetical protein
MDDRGSAAAQRQAGRIPEYVSCVNRQRRGGAFASVLFAAANANPPISGSGRMLPVGSR